jgi:muramidase (phage lysozyme)
MITPQFFGSLKEKPGMAIALPREAYGLLNAIAGPESGGRYNVTYGGGTFDDYSQHPNRAVPITSGPNAGQTSSAAGKYQFLGPTWDEVAAKNGLTDFSPDSQDQGAWALAQDRYKATTGGDLQSDLQAGKLQDVAKALSSTWTSLSGGIEAQPGGAGEKLLANYQAGMNGGGPAATGASPATPNMGLLAAGGARPQTQDDPMKAIRGLLASDPSTQQQQPSGDAMPQMGLLSAGAAPRFALSKIKPLKRMI